MVAIRPLSMSSAVSTESLLHSLSPITKKIMGVVLVAVAALALCYALYMRCLKQPVTQKTTGTDEDSKKVAKETIVAQEKLPSPKNARPTQEPQVKKTDDMPEKLEVEQTDNVKMETEQPPEKVDGEPQKVQVDYTAEIPTWTFSHDKIQEVLRLRKQAIDTKNDAQKKACEDYFQRSLTTSGDHILDVYNEVQKEPELTELFAELAIGAWKGQQGRSIVEKHAEKHLQTIIHENQFSDIFYATFMATLLDKVLPHEISVLPCLLIHPLSQIQVQMLTEGVLKGAKKPLEILKFLIKSGTFTGDPREKEKTFEVMRSSFKSSTPGQELQELLDAPKDDSLFILTLSDDDLKKLILQWKTALDSKQCGKRLARLFDARSFDTEKIFDVCVTLNMDLEQLLDSVKGTHAQPQLCSAYVVHALKSKITNAQKIDKIRYVLSIIGSDAYSQIPFGTCLAALCPTEHLHFLLTKIVIESQGAVPYMMEAIFTKLLDDVKTSKDRVQKAFETYWTFWQILDVQEPPLSLKILSLIKTEEFLESVYLAISPQAADRGEIIKLLKDEHQHIFGRKFRINLPQDVIDRIIV